jgi:hypothetical protein
MNFTTTTNKTVSLHAVTTELLKCYGNVNKEQKRYFVNEVPEDLYIPRNSNWLAPLMGDMMEIILKRQEDKVVHISASFYRNKPQLFAK